MAPRGTTKAEQRLVDETALFTEAANVHHRLGIHNWSDDHIHRTKRQATDNQLELLEQEQQQLTELRLTTKFAVARKSRIRGGRRGRPTVNEIARFEASNEFEAQQAAEEALDGTQRALRDASALSGATIAELTRRELETPPVQAPLHNRNIPLLRSATALKRVRPDQGVDMPALTVPILAPIPPKRKRDSSLPPSKGFGQDFEEPDRKRNIKRPRQPLSPRDLNKGCPKQEETNKDGDTNKRVPGLDFVPEKHKFFSDDEDKPQAQNAKKSMCTHKPRNIHQDHRVKAVYNNVEYFDARFRDPTLNLKDPRGNTDDTAIDVDHWAANVDQRYIDTVS